WHPVARLRRLAYDHAAVVRLAGARLRAKLPYTNLLYTLLPRTLTPRGLQALYEALPRRPPRPPNLPRRVLSPRVLPPPGPVRRGAHRPAALYAFRSRRPMTMTVL